MKSVPFWADHQRFQALLELHGFAFFSSLIGDELNGLRCQIDVMTQSRRNWRGLPVKSPEKPGVEFFVKRDDNLRFGHLGSPERERLCERLELS